MKLIRTATILTLMTGCVFASSGVRTAEALTLMDLFRKRTVPVEDMQGFPGSPSVMVPEKKQALRPLPKVTAPQYYTYKADSYRRIDTAKLADPVVTGSVATDMPTSATDMASERAFLPEVTAYASNDVAKAVEAFYANNEKMIWIDNGAVNDAAKSALSVLKSADAVGLDPADYAVALPDDAVDMDGPTKRQQSLVTFEVRLSAAVLTYIADNQRGRIDPNRISGYHDFKRKTVDLVAKLKNVALSHDVAAYLASQAPSGSEFVALKTELAQIRATAANDAPRVEIAPGTLLKPGLSDPQLANVIEGIRQKGSEALKREHAETLAAYQGTPDYTPELVALVEGFQKEHGLKPDGVVGKASIRLLTGGDNNEAKVDKLKIAMEQARWLPNTLGDRYVFINQPAFKVYYHENGVEQFNMRVVVGSKQHQTFFFEDEIQTVEFNPYWGVPQSIIINEMLPKLRSDPGYLDRLGYQVEVGGQAVASSSVDWDGSTAGISVRQPPSSDNALGELKILFPNAHAIYMHDTPSKSFFARDQRALSHGCVRLADPRRMAAAVLGTTVDDVAKQIAGGRNKGVTVPQRIPVYVAYFTAWPNKDGKIEYFNDVYDRDMYMDRAFDATSAARRKAI